MKDKYTFQDLLGALPKYEEELKSEWKAARGDRPYETLKQTTLSSVLAAAFGWEGTFQGHDYWHDIYEKLQNDKLPNSSPSPFSNSNIMFK